MLKKAQHWHQDWRKRETQSETLIEKRWKINQAVRLIDSLPRCFLWRCQEQHNCSAPSSLSFCPHHTSLATSPIITLSSPPKCLNKLPQNSFFYSIVPPQLSLVQPPVLFSPKTLTHLKWLQNYTPLICMCSLHWQRKSSLTRATLNSSRILSFVPTLIIQLQWSSGFLLFVFIMLSDMTGWTQMQWVEKAVGHCCTLVIQNKTKRAQSGCRKVENIHGLATFTAVCL